MSDQEPNTDELFRKIFFINLAGLFLLIAVLALISYFLGAG